VTWSTPPAVVAGDSITATLWNTYVRDNQLSAGVWQSWTPTLTADGGGLSLGSTGTATGRFARLGATVWWSAEYAAAGSGVSAGTGVWRVSFPVAPVAERVVAHGWLFNGVHRIVGVHGTQALIEHGAAAPLAAPTWAAGHALVLSGTYEAA